MKTHRRIISSKNQPNALALLSAWLILIIAPVFLFVLLFEQVLCTGENHLARQAQVTLMNEADNFRLDLSAEAMLKARLPIELAGLLKEIGDSQNLTTDKLRQEMEQRLGFNLFVIFRNDSNDNIDFSYNHKFAKNLLISKTMLKNLFQTLEIDKAISGMNVSESEIFQKNKTRAQAFLKSTFKIIGELKFEENEPLLALSGKPELGSLYFCLTSSPNLPGVRKEKFIFIFREQDIKIIEIMRFAASQIPDNKLQRKFVVTRLNSIDMLLRMNSAFSMFKTTSEGISFYTVFPERLLKRIIQGNTFYPFHMKNLLDDFPLLQTTIGKRHIEHPLRRFLKPLKTGGKILAILSAIFFLRLYLFGSDLPFKIRAKIVLTLIFVAMLPYTAFYLLAAYHEEFRQSFARHEISTYLNHQVEEFNIAINSYRTRLENENARFGEKLGFLEDFELVPYINLWLKKWPVAQIFTRINGVDGTLSRTQNEKSLGFETELKDLLFTTVENSFRKKDANGKENDGHFGLFKIKVKGIGSIFASIGLILNSNFTNVGDFYSLIPVFKENDDKKGLSSVFLIKYNSKLILNDFFTGQAKFLENENRAGFSIQKCFIPVRNQSELPSSAEFICRPDFPRNLATSMARKVIETRSEETIFSQSGERQRIIHVEYSNNLNCILVLLATQVNQDSFAILPGAEVMIVYSFAVLLLILVLMRKYFVEPVILLQESAEATAEGDFNHQLCLSSGDEFESLGNAFNQMVKGLAERERVASFVSENVLAETADATELLLEPGGEKIQVSVLFCAMPELKNYFSEEKADSLLEFLGQLIDCADAVSRKHGGIIDKIIEGTIMIVFRQRDAGNSHVISACKAALEIAAEFPQSDCPLRTVSGIASGEAVSGKIGSKDGKLDHTVIGNPVNLAARLKNQAHIADQTGILLCPHTIRMLKGIGKLRFIERVEIKGRTRTFPMYELLALRTQ